MYIKHIPSPSHSHIFPHLSYSYTYSQSMYPSSLYLCLRMCLSTKLSGNVCLYLMVGEGNAAVDVGEPNHEVMQAQQAGVETYEL